jgi:hypothetical protein
LIAARPRVRLLVLPITSFFWAALSFVHAARSAPWRRSAFRADNGLGLGATATVALIWLVVLHLTTSPGD